MFDDDTTRSLPLYRMLWNTTGPWWSGGVLLSCLLIVVGAVFFYHRLTDHPDSVTAEAMMERVYALPVISLEDFTSFLDSTDRSFSFRKIGDQFVVAYAMPDFESRVYRLDYRGSTRQYTEELLMARLNGQK